MLLGQDAMTRLQTARVIIFGVGGVGSWCAESLVRTGFMNVTIVDCDVVSVTNINRQAMATTATVGLPKVEVMKKRLLEINSAANVTAYNMVFSEQTAGEFNLDGYDFIIDAIDSLKDKVRLILSACNTGAKFFSSMGAALKTDPSKVKTAEFWKVEGCPLARALRKKFKAMGQFPSRKFVCVYSDEQPPAQSQTIANQDCTPIIKPVTNGSIVHITAIFGFTIAGMVVRCAMEDVGAL